MRTISSRQSDFCDINYSIFNQKLSETEIRNKTPVFSSINHSKTFREFLCIPSTFPGLKAIKVNGRDTVSTFLQLTI